MTILIPYKEDLYNGLELKYALRSIENNLTGWTSIVLIGNAPEWYKGTVIHHEDKPGRKEFNIYQKILAAYGRVSDDFLFWNDDHYLLTPLDVSEIKYWQNGLLKHELERPVSAQYRSDIQNTLDLLDGNFHDYHRPLFYNFDIHTPIIYNKNTFKELFKDLTIEICIKSYYSIMSGMQGEFMEDCKIDGYVDKERLKDVIYWKTFFSSGSNLCKPTIEVLEELFPEKSNFEK